MVLKSCLEGGSRATIYMLGIMLPVLFSYLFSVTHAVKRIFKRGCLTLCVEGAETRFAASLISKRLANGNAIFTVCYLKVAALSSVSRLFDLG